MRVNLVPAILGGVIAALVIGMVGVVSAQTGTQPGPRLVVTPAVVQLKSGAKLTIIGSGFQSGQELRVLRTKAGAATSDLSSSLKPEVKVDDAGMFVTTYTFGRMPRDVEEGPAEIVVVDENFQELARAPVAYCEPAEGDVEVPAWCPKPKPAEQ